MLCFLRDNKKKRRLKRSALEKRKRKIDDARKLMKRLNVNAKREQRMKERSVKLNRLN